MSQLSALSLPEALAALGAAVRARRRLIAIPAVLAVVATIVVNAAAPREAQLTVSFDSLNQSSTMADLGIPAPPPPTADQIRSDAVFDRMVRERLVPRGATVASLRNDLSLGGFNQGRDATLVARGDADSDAIALVNGWAGSLIRTRQGLILGQLDRARSALRGQLGGLPAGRQVDARRAIRNQMSRLDAVRHALGQEVSISRGAALTSGFGVRNELLALLLGALVGALAALVLESRDARLRTAPTAEAAFGAPVLGTLAAGDGWAARTALVARVETVLAARNRSKASHLLLLTGTDGLPGQHHAGVELGRALAREGRPVAVVLWSEGHHAAPDPAVPAWNAADAPLTVVRAHGGADELRERVAELERRAWLVLVLAPPPRRAPGALLLAHWADAWLVLAALGQTSGEEARELAEDLEGVSVHPSGVVLAGPRVAGEAA